MSSGDVVNVFDFFTQAQIDDVTSGADSVDCSAAIQIAFDACANSHKVLYFPDGTYHCSTTTGFTSTDHHIDMVGQLRWKGASHITFLTINADRRHINVNVRRDYPIDWSSDNSIGCLIYGQTNHVTITNIQNFTIGLQLGSLGSSAYNSFYVGMIRNSKYSVDFYAKTVAEYTNQNTFFGGRYTVDSSVGVDTISRYGVRFRSDTTFTSDNNIFYDPCFELDSHNITGGAECACVKMERGVFNLFHYGREEKGATTSAVIEENNSANNRYYFAFGETMNIEYRNCDVHSSEIKSMRYIEDLTQNLVFDSGNMADRAILYESTNRYAVDSLSFQSFSASSPTFFNDSLTINSDRTLSWPSTRSATIFFDVEGKTRFFVKPKLGSGSLRLGVAVFDSSGTRLTSSGGGHPYVRGYLGGSMSYSSDFGGHYQRGGDDDSPIYFNITSDVKKVQLLIIGTGTMDLASFQVFADGQANVYSGIDEMRFKDRLAVSAPSAGTWAVGDTVWNTTPSAGGTMGWVCTTAGTPGTWKTFGSITS